MLEFLVGGGGGDQEAFAIAGCKTTDYAGACDGDMADGDYVLKFSFENAEQCGEVSEDLFVVVQRRVVESFRTCKNSRRHRWRRGRKSL